MSADLVADTRNRILTARYHTANGIALDARTWIDAAERLADELEAAQAKLQAVLALHERGQWVEYGVPVFDEFDSATRVERGCTLCRRAWPCATVRAAGVDGEPT